MKEISLNILDICYNSLSAKCTKLIVDINYNHSANTLSVTIDDNGCGMDEQMLKQVTSPFTTSRTTRPVGLGIPFFAESATQTGGTFNITSTKGVGTTLQATYIIDSIDRMPMGDIAQTMVSLIMSDEKINYVLNYCVDEREFTFDTNEIKAILGEDISLTSSEVIFFISNFISEAISQVNGGKQII